MSDPRQDLQESAYYSVVRAFFAGNKLGFDTEDFLDELKTVLGISEDRHLEFLDAVQQDAEAARMNTYAPSGSAPQGPAPAAINTASSLQLQRSLTGSLNLHQNPLMTMHDPFMGGQLGQMGMPASGGGSKKSKSHRPTPVGTPVGGQHSTGQKRPPALQTGSKLANDYYGGPVTKKSKSVVNTPASTPFSTPASTKPKQGVSKAFHTPSLLPHYDSVLLPDVGTAETQLAQLNAREREIFIELLQLGVKEDDHELNAVHRALLKWYRLDAQQQAMVAELESMSDPLY